MKKSVQIFIAVVASWFASGCASGYAVYRYDGKPVNQARIDQAAEICRGHATAASMGRTYQDPANSVAGAVLVGVGNAMQQEQIYKSCMAQHGYRMVPKQS